MANDRNVVRLYKEKLNMLLDVAQTVNEDSSVEELMQEFENLLSKELRVGKILVYTQDGDVGWQCILQCGVSDDQKNEIDIERDLLHITTIENMAMNDIESLRGFDAVIPLRHKYKVMGYVLVGDNELGDGVSPTLRNLKFIQILSNIIIVFIENKKMQARLLRQEGLRQELALASKIQAGLVPHERQLIQTGHTRAMSYYHPHDKVGGDYFDVLGLGNNWVGFCMADVSGKGMAAALLMSNFQAMVRALFTARVDLRTLVAELNKRVSANTGGEKFITMFIGRYNCLTGILSYVNAGHMPPILYHEGNLSELNTGSIGLGMLDEMPEIEMGRIRLHKGDLILTYTDGLVEVDNGESVGSNADRLSDIMSQGLGIEETMKQVAALAERTRRQGKSFDDTSVLAIEIIRKPSLSI